MFDRINIFTNDKKISKILKTVTMSQEILQELQAKADAATTSLNQANTSLQNISADIQRIKDTLPAEGGLTAEEVEQLRASLDGVVNTAASNAAAADALDKENEPTA